MSFYEKWIEVDYNPFILFSSEGKILSLNASAQFLLGVTNTSTLFEYATTYASTSFGFKTTHMRLELGHFVFFAITVGYENEEEIGMRLYRLPSVDIQVLSNRHKGEDLVNIYTLIDLAISSHSISSKQTYLRDIDPTLPELRINADAFIKLLNAIFTSAQDSLHMTLKLFFKIGEHIKIEDQKYSIFTIQAVTNGWFQADESKLQTLAKKLGATITIKSETIGMDLALITK